MVKTCSWGTCKCDTRYPERIENVRFIPFPKPKTNREKCLRWVKSCGRPHFQLNVSNIDRHKFVCSKHFVSPSGPTAEFPDPIPADGSKSLRVRCHWKNRTQLSDKEHEEENTLSSVESLTVPDAEQAPCRSDTSSQDNLPLQLLSAAAEIDALKAQLQMQQEHLNQQRIVNNHLQVENSMLKDQQPETKLPIFTVSSLLQQEKKIPGLFEYYTGFKHSTFTLLLQYLTDETRPVLEKKRKDFENLRQDEQLLLTLMRLRHNFGLKDLACRFLISTQAVSEVFTAWIDHMYITLGVIPIWPTREDIIANMPPKYKSEFPTTIAIVDCTELKTQKPSYLKLQSQMYSDYKSSTTLKALVACDPMGNIIFVSELFTGSMSDKEITEKSGLSFYNLLQRLLDAGYVKPGDAIMADKGFTISDELAKMGLKLNIPPFTSAGRQLSQGDVDLTQKIAQHRIHVERAIRRVSTFTIVSTAFQQVFLALLIKCGLFVAF